VTTPKKVVEDTARGQRAAEKGRAIEYPRAKALPHRQGLERTQASQGYLSRGKEGKLWHKGKIDGLERQKEVQK
jgi:hypothetical protein